MIPRLPEDANDLSITITINKKLRPYFELIFTRKKLPGETKEQFGLRLWKIAALNDYLTDTAKSERDVIEQQSTYAMTALQGDIGTLTTEVD